MPAVGVTAKLPSPPDNVALPPALDSHEPLPRSDHREPPAPLDLDRREPFPAPGHREPPAPLDLDRHEPLPAPDHEPPTPLDLDRHEPLPAPDHEPPSFLDFDPVREALCSGGPVAAAWAAQDAELDAEIAALEAAGVLTAPAEEEQPGPRLGS